MQTRLTDLEIKVAFLEDSLIQLDDVMRSIRDEVDAMRREIGDLRSVAEALVPADINEKPPHY